MVFQVDDIDADAASGLSVLVTGVAKAVRDAGALVRLEQLGLVAWAGGGRSHSVRITLTEVTGRRVLSRPGAEDLLPL